MATTCGIPETGVPLGISTMMGEGGTAHACRAARGGVLQDRRHPPSLPGVKRTATLPSPGRTVLITGASGTVPTGTTKRIRTCGAGAFAASPACDARTPHKALAVAVTTLPVIEQVSGVHVSKVTDNPLVAVACECGWAYRR